MSNELVELQEIADRTTLAKLEAMPSVQRAVTLAKGMVALRSKIQGEVLDMFCELAGTNLGFKMDKPTYPKEVIRDCIIEAMIRSAAPVGNEFNIISGKCYLTKEYYERMCSETVQNLRVTEGVPVIASSGGGALVPMLASWSVNGLIDRIDCVKSEGSDTRIAVRVNKGMGADAILGKAYRKLFARIYRRATGSQWLEAEEPGESTVESVEVAEEAAQEPEGLNWGEIESELAKRTMIKEVQAYQSALEESITIDADAFKLAEVCGVACDRIRGARGGRSND